ncbi:MAG: molybdopterin-synthase adenylyltransferase MoeB [Planctomycetes bacterium]|nr:molybdopterin-synthase adenylyltransferase MoeB [Planctomycetota bacterium]
MIDFTEEQLERYSRNILLQDLGPEGQSKIMEGKVLVIGTGGLGAPVSLYLAAAGVGTIGLVDSDVVDLSNLQRQVVHFTPDVGTPKVDSAEAKLKALNPGIEIKKYHTFVVADNIRDIIREYDFVIDGTDNFSAKFLINDACILENKPYSHGGILRFDGQTMTIKPGESACYRCVFNAPPPKNAVPTCSQAGVLGGVAGMLGTIQSVEAMKYLSGVGELLTDNLLTFNAASMNFRKVKFKKNPSCPVCGENPSIKELFDEEQPTCDLKK